MTSRGVAKRYARALHALASSDGNAETVAEALGQVATVLAAPSVAGIVRNPAIGSDGRRAVVRSLIEQLGLPKLVGNCLYILAERQRLEIVDDLWQAFVQLVDEAVGRGRVVIRSAAPLAESHAEQILEVLRRVTGKKELIPVLEVDPDLLGGVVCEAEGVVYDGSIRTQVNQLAQRMVSETHSGE